MTSDNAGYIALEYWVTCRVCTRRMQVYDNVRLDGSRGIDVPGWTNAGRGCWYCPDCAHLAVAATNSGGTPTDAETS